jgi:hypothetical protein
MGTRVSKTWLGLLAVVGLAAGGAANAVPCSPAVLSGGILPSVACKDGPSGDVSPGAADLNAGFYFGSNTWSLLDTTADGVDSAVWSFSGGNPNGRRLGTFHLASGLWGNFSKLAVVLNGPGGLWDDDTRWSAYLLPKGYDGVYGWTYDFVHRLRNASIYGVEGRTVSVSEPASLAIVLLALGAATLVLRRRLASARR